MNNETLVSPPTWRRVVLTAAACATFVGIVRVAIIILFGSSLPFWDQWGAEGAALYKPLLEGNFDWNQIWVPHNEHRIALTRLWTMAIFELNQQQWDARVQCLFNTLLISAAVGLFVAYLQRALPAQRARWLCVLLVIGASLPFSWENTIAGFQSQFYFSILASLGLLWTAAHRTASPATLVLLCALALLAVFSLATGVLGIAAALLVLGARALFRHNSWHAMIVFMLPLLAILAAALWNTPAIDGHTTLQAQGLIGHVLGLAITTSWPLVPPAFLLFAAPLAWFAWRTWQRREVKPVDLFFAGLFAWSALTAFAIAHSRGNGLLVVPSRYTDLLAFGSIAYAYFALRMADDATSRARRLLCLAVPCLIGAGFLLQSVLYWPYLLDRHFLMRIAEVNVRAFLEGDPSALSDKPALYISFPDAASLAVALNDPSIRATLPVSVRGARTQNDIAPGCRLDSAAADSAVHCGTAADADPGALPLGPLSAVSYRLWQTFSLPLLPRLEAGSPVPARHDMRCSIDAVNAAKPGAGNVFTLPYASAFRVAGWTGRPGEPPRARALHVGLVADNGDQYQVRVKPRLKREDVVTALRETGFRWSGFDVGLDGSLLPPGRYRLLLGDVGVGLCDTQHWLDVLKAGDERLRY